MKLTPELCAERMLERLGRQLECLAEIFRQGKRMLDCAAAGDSSAIANAIRQRQKQLVRLRVLTEELNGYKLYQQETLTVWPAELREQVEVATAGVRRELEKILEFDVKLRAAIADKMNDMQGELERIRVAKRVNSAYKPVVRRQKPRRSNRMA